MSSNTGLVRVRPAQLSDLDTVVGFNRAMALETEDKELDTTTVSSGVAAVLQNHDLGFYLIAEFEGSAAGQLLVTREWSDWRNAFFWWIQSVYVQPQYRRRGIYRALDQRVRAEALRQGNVCGVRLYVERSNGAAQMTYRDLGMTHSHYDMYEVEFGQG